MRHLIRKTTLVFFILCLTTSAIKAKEPLKEKGLKSSSSNVSQKDTLTYTHPQLQYRISYPASFVIKPLAMAVSFSAPEEDKKFYFSPNVNIISQTFDTTTLSLDEFYESAKKSLLLRAPTTEIIEEKKTKVARVDSRRLVYRRKEKKAEFQFLQEIFIFKNRVYVITYTALVEQFNRYLPEVEKMIKSFEFIS
ncbi:MAG: hypothetical protein N2606_01650 [Candidatus Omnitrophica bacterium]|nr:hypothetical protein [Candidatus Omnitrophota bacterium]